MNFPGMPIPNAANYAMYKYHNTAIRGSGITPILWAHDGKFATYDVNAGARGGRLGILDYPGAGTGWGMYYMPSPLDYFVVSPSGKDDNLIASCHSMHYNLIPRLVWNEIFLKGITGFMMIHAYTKYKDEQGSEQWRYTSNELEGEDVIEEGTDICGGVFLGCQSLKTIEQNIPDFENLQKEAIGNTNFTNVENKILVSSIGSSAASASSLSSSMDNAINSGSRIDDIIKNSNLFKNWGFIYVINNGSIMIRSKHQNDDGDIENGPFIRCDGPSKKILIHGASKESQEAKYCKNIIIESSATDFDIIYFDEETNQITVKALNKIYLRTFEGEILLKSDDDIILQGKNVNINATSNINVSAGGNINIGAGGILNLNGSQTLINTAGKIPFNASLITSAAGMSALASSGILGFSNITNEGLMGMFELSTDISSQGMSLLTNITNTGLTTFSGLGNLNTILSSGIPVLSTFTGAISSITSSISSITNIAGQFTNLIQGALGSITTPLSNFSNLITTMTGNLSSYINLWNQVSSMTKPRQFTKSLKNEIEVLSNTISDNIETYCDFVG